MSTIAIVSDSTASMPDAVVQEYDIHIAPQVIIWNQETMLDGIDISAAQFYERLTVETSMPTTSQATVASFKEIYEKLVPQGRSIVTIVLNEQLSGTYQSAMQAKEMFPGADIEVISSDSVAMGLGFQVLAAAREAKRGGSKEDVVRVARDAQNQTGLLIVLGTLEFLRRGGRIGGAAHLVGTALNLKPVLEVRDGRIEPIERIRTKKKAIARMLDILEERVQGHRPLRITVHHTGVPEDADSVRSAVVDRFAPDELFTTLIGPVVGVHGGPGAVAIAYSVDI